MIHIPGYVNNFSIIYCSGAEVGVEDSRKRFKLKDLEKDLRHSHDHLFSVH